MLPPSPRKIRADGRDRLCGRKPRQAPHSAAPVATSQTSRLHEPEHGDARRATTRAIVLDGAVHVVEEVEGVDDRDDPDDASRAGRPRRRGRATSRGPTAHSIAAERRPRQRRAAAGATVRRSSSVPTAQRTTTPPSTGSVRPGSDVSARTATTKPVMTAAPPRYGVGARVALVADRDGRRTRSARRARIATGVAAYAMAIASARPTSSRASSGNSPAPDGCDMKTRRVTSKARLDPACLVLPRLPRLAPSACDLAHVAGMAGARPPSRRARRCSSRSPPPRTAAEKALWGPATLPDGDAPRSASTTSSASTRCSCR